MTDAANEAKDNVKYLATLEKSLEPMFTGKVQEIAETLPALITNIKMMYTIARYYSTPEHMTRLFTKITNQVGGRRGAGGGGRAGAWAAEVAGGGG